MILPIHVFGDPVLRADTEEVTENTEELQDLIDNMIETMRGAAGLGLAGPQVGRPERLFVLDLAPMEDEVEEELPPQPMVIINPEIIWQSDEECDFEEGCLSIPGIREMVTRPERIRLRYVDRDFEEQELEVGDLLARVMQHEFDHLEGVLFTDYLSSFRKRLLRRRLREMKQGDIEADYALATDAA